MELSPGQTSALDAIAAWYEAWRTQHNFYGERKNGDVPQVFYMAGYAGTGKTTIAKEIPARCGARRVQYAAFTGKAALVLERKDCRPASTLHSIMYIPNDEKEAELDKARAELADLEDQLRQGKGSKTKIEGEMRRLRKDIEGLCRPTFALNPNSPLYSCDLLNLDECSMVDEELGQDALSFGVPILVQGDPGQLPPIKGAGYFTNRTPDVMLTEIHRQALDNPIIKLATIARSGERLSRGDYGNSRVIPKHAITKDIAMSCEQIITGSNKARRMMNAEMRAMRGLSGDFPKKGDRVICLRNNKQDRLLNGQIEEVAEDADTESNEKYFKLQLLDKSYPIWVHKLCFTKPDDLEIMNYNQRKLANEFDFGYAITCHKAQGSQYDSVLVYDDSFHWDNDLHTKWSYTAITRAVDRVIYAR